MYEQTKYNQSLAHIKVVNHMLAVVRHAKKDQLHAMYQAFNVHCFYQIYGRPTPRFLNNIIKL